MKSDDTKKKQTCEHVWKEYVRGLSFNSNINLDETVEVNENFFIGRRYLPM